MEIVLETMTLLEAHSLDFPITSASKSHWVCYLKPRALDNTVFIISLQIT